MPPIFNNQCPKCKTNKNTLRINDWNVKGTIFLKGYFIDVSIYDFFCKDCSCIWDQNRPKDFNIYDPVLNEKEKEKEITCSGCSNPPIYCDCHGYFE